MIRKKLKIINEIQFEKLQHAKLEICYYQLAKIENLMNETNLEPGIKLQSSKEDYINSNTNLTQRRLMKVRKSGRKKELLWFEKEDRCLKCKNYYIHTENTELDNKWIACCNCAGWYHYYCTKLFALDLNDKQIEKINFKYCSMKYKNK